MIAVRSASSEPGIEVRASERLSAILSTASWARSNATPPPGTTPSSIAAFVVETRLRGREVTVMALLDGDSWLLLPWVRNLTRLSDGDREAEDDTGRDVGGFRLLKSFRVPVNKAVLLERKTLGFISDEVALETTAMYEQRERKSWRSDTTRTSGVGIDAPKSAVILTGL